MSKLTILHIDDDESILRLVAKKLQGVGYDVVSLTDPLQAIEQIYATGAKLVLLDIDMPGKNGIEVLKEIKADDGGVQVVMLSGVVTMVTALEAMRNGAEACLFKPVTKFAPLLNAIETAEHKMECWSDCFRELKQRRDSEAAAVAQ